MKITRVVKPAINTENPLYSMYSLKRFCGILILQQQEAHGPHRSPEKTVQINKHI